MARRRATPASERPRRRPSATRPSAWPMHVCGVMRPPVPTMPPAPSRTPPPPASMRRTPPHAPPARASTMPAWRPTMPGGRSRARKPVAPTCRPSAIRRRHDSRASATSTPSQHPTAPSAGRRSLPNALRAGAHVRTQPTRPPTMHRQRSPAPSGAGASLPLWPPPSDRPRRRRPTSSVRGSRWSPAPSGPSAPPSVYSPMLRRSADSAPRTTCSTPVRRRCSCQRRRPRPARPVRPDARSPTSSWPAIRRCASTSIVSWQERGWWRTSARFRMTPRACS